jgi:hypothetical protein
LRDGLKMKISGLLLALTVLMGAGTALAGAKPLPAHCSFYDAKMNCLNEPGALVCPRGRAVSCISTQTCEAGTCRAYQVCRCVPQQ